MDKETHIAASTESKLSTPVAILLGALIIAGAVLVTKYMPAPNSANVAAPGQPQAQSANLEAVRPIGAEDHIRGNPDAPVKVVMYSDTECPFCKRFHNTMQELMSTYGAEGKVAWVYRHFPLDQLHKKARKEAVASECAAEQGGNDAFWAYMDRMMEITPSNDGLDSAELPKIAAFIGLDVTKFNACLSSDKYAKRVQDDADNALKTGGQGTPWSIVIGPNGKKYELSGAQPIDAVRQLVDIALADK
ncbi:MAG: Periplasmic thiol:disulfide interchange protein DsbA [Parcubacteria bacterium C7867-001]|nr:MAG: Periplasmic thiol:disulfide interchange protein DsbA [Parcubacteria bacterium C7867-001]